MNKYKKLAIAAVSMVMAGTMAASLAACGGGGGGGDDIDTPKTGADLYGILNEDGTINYAAYERESEVTLNLAVGYNSQTTGAFYNGFLAEMTMPDGKTYADGQAKPAWAQMGKDLNITWADKYRGMGTGTGDSGNLPNMLADNYYSEVDLFTVDLSVAVDYAAAGTDILNLGDYLDYMPNLSAFLDANPIVYLSLLQDGMDAETGEGKTLYVAPYFDGYDDIERYNLIRHDWAKILLNGDESTGSTATYATECASSTSITAYFTGDNYEIQSLTSDGTGYQTIKKDYAAALTAVKGDTDLATAYKAIDASGYNGTSGNIVDIMNAALAANANATGAQLATLYREYIDVAYTVNGSAAYAANERANLFIGYDAAWDVDDLAALLRVVKTNASALGLSEHGVGGIAPRRGDSDRTPDLVSLAAQLYGVRGANSRYEYTYIDADGTLQDARNDEALYQAMINLNKFTKEGLVADYKDYGSFQADCGIDTTNGVEYMLMYDYSQTQTLTGFYVEDPTLGSGRMPENIDQETGYYFAPILTPVAKWSVNGENDTIMRFTESWRSTKTGGLALNGALKNNEEKLKAALQFVDYLYSEDGQIVSTYGPMADDANGTNGFWYNGEPVAKGNNTFQYKGNYYVGTEYKGSYTPTVTQKVLNSFKGKEVNGWKLQGNAASAKLSFTSYARMLIGSTLPVGVKDQSFENQLTSEMGKAGANTVGTALAKGVVKGMSLDINENSYWYTVVPSGLPLPGAAVQVINNTNMLDYKYLTGTKQSGKNFFSIFSHVILYGTDTDYNQQGVEYHIPATAAEIVAELSKAIDNGGYGGQSRENANADGWEQAKEYWDYLK